MLTPGERAGLHMGLQYVPSPDAHDEGHYVSFSGGLENRVRLLTKADATSVLPLYDYQSIYVDYMAQNRLNPAAWQYGGGQVYVHLKTGLGKTYVALALVAALRMPALFVVPTILLRQDGVETAQSVYPNLRVVAYSNDLERKCQKQGLPLPNGDNVDIMFCVVNTARTKPPEFFKGFGIVVLDEAHEMCSKTNVELLWNYAPYLVGLSATPLVRPDEMDRIVPKFLGKPLSLSDVVHEVYGAAAEKMLEVLDYNFEGKVREVWYEGHPAAVLDDEMTSMTILKIGRLITDPFRVELVAAETERILHLHETLTGSELAEAGLGMDEHGVMRRHSVFVFAEYRDFLDILKGALLRRVDEREFYLMDPGEAEPASGASTVSALVLRGGATEEDRKEARRTRVVLTTYGYSRRGVSFEHMTALVEATPRRNGYMQILGRICRLTKNPSLLSIRRIVIDIRDRASSLDSQSSGRRDVYREKGWPITHIKAAHTDFQLENPPTPAQPHTMEKPVTMRSSKGEAAEAAGGTGGDHLGDGAGRHTLKHLLNK